MSSNPVYPWEQPRKPWELFCWISLQFILVDAESKWPTSDTNEKCCSEQHNTVEVLRSMFSRFGILHQLYCIRQWFTIVYKQFCEWNGTQYPLVAPYCPSSNGEAEKFIQTFLKYVWIQGTSCVISVEEYLILLREKHQQS